MRERMRRPLDKYKNISRLGRSLRVLHIGNIANNAYKNALVLRRKGVQADVLCHDYYHIMGCPEWEDGDFTGPIDDFLPDWFSTEMKGWSRPAWFVQGPGTTCIQYLRAKHLGMKFVTWLLRHYLEARYWQIVQDDRQSKGMAVRPTPIRFASVLWLVRAMAIDVDPDFGDECRIATLSSPAEPRQASNFTESSSSTDLLLLIASENANGDQSEDIQRDIMVSTVYAESIKLTYTHRDLLIASLRLPYGLLFDATIKRAILQNRYDNLLVRLWLRRKRVVGVDAMKELTAQLSEAASNRSYYLNVLKVCWRHDRGVLKRHYVQALTICKKIKGLHTRAKNFLKRVRSDLILDRLQRWIHQLASPVRQKMKTLVPVSDWDRRLPEVQRRYEILMLGASDIPQDEKVRLSYYVKSHPLRFFDVLSSYDIIQGYSIDGLLPWINGMNNFASYEHGTVRDIPWEPTLLGAVCKTVYEQSPLVFVTNSDVIPSLDRLGIERDRRLYVPHGFDDTKIRAWQRKNKDLRVPKEHIHVFCPARQHWKTGSPTWRKGNDVIIRAIAELKSKEYAVRATFVEWGAEVAESKALIEELNVSDVCSWVRPMRKADLWRAYCEAHVVADQFIMPAIGAVTYEVMALGRRVITRIDVAQLRHFFGEEPPLLAAETVADVVAALEDIARDPNDQAGIGSRSASWMSKYHSTERITDMHLAAYDRLLEIKQRDASLA